MFSTPIVVGRQAIHDREGATVAYELLFRSDREARTAATDLGGDRMSAEVALNAVNIGVDEVLDGRRAFCNVDRGVLVGDVPFVLPPERAVLEVLETVRVDEEVIEGCRRLVEAGYELALDDFVAFDGDAALLALASIVKVDVRQTQGEALTAIVEHCRPYGVRLLAEKVETAEEYEDLRGRGFDLFQGYYLNRPVVVVGSTVEEGTVSHLRMASLLLGSELDFEQVLDLLHGDPGLALQVIRLASLGRSGETRRKVTNIRGAVVLAGSRAIRNYMALMLLKPAPTAAADRFVDVLVRARAVELLCTRLEPSSRETGFAAGMLSALDLLLSRSSHQLRESLDLDEDLAAAAFGDPVTGRPTSRLGALVRAATAFQLEAPQDADAAVPAEELETAYGEAFVWAAATLAELGRAETDAA